MLRTREENSECGIWGMCRMDIEARMEDVKRRYGSYPEEKWNSNLNIKKEFEKKIGKDIYTVVEKDTFHF